MRVTCPAPRELPHARRAASKKQEGEGGSLERIKKPELDEHSLECEFEYIAHKLDLDVNQLKIIFRGNNKASSDYRSKRNLVDFSAKIMSILGLEKRLYK